MLLAARLAPLVGMHAAPRPSARPRRSLLRCAPTPNDYKKRSSSGGGTTINIAHVWCWVAGLRRTSPRTRR